MDKMLQIQRPICSELTLRLVHDISPEYCSSSEDDDDENLARRREQFIFSCLAQTNINNNSITDVSQTTCDTRCERAASITETYAKLEWESNHLEKINNHINEQHLNKVLEDHNHTINLINNNFLQCSAYENDSSDKENEAPPTRAWDTCQTQDQKVARRPRKLPDVPKKHTAAVVPLKPIPLNNEKCLADELQEALVKLDNSDSESDDVFLPNAAKQLPKVYPKYSGNLLEELKQIKFNSVSKNTRAYLNSDNVYLKEDSTGCGERSRQSSESSNRGRKGSSGDEGSKKSACSMPSTHYQDLVVTHRGMHRFVPRHKDEMAIEIGDPIHVNSTGDDLWCDGVNLRSNLSGIFPSMYATDLEFLEEEEEDDGCSKFILRFLGSVEVNYHKGDEVLTQAINKVALSRRAVKTSLPPPVCTVEVSQYGVRMLDKSKTGHEEDADTFTHYFALKNITFCGHHPRNERYFGFITKHPNQYRYACHVFLGERSTCSVTDAVGQAFKRFYQEYMAFTHPTEDIYME